MRATSEKLGNGLAKMTVEMEAAELHSEYERAIKRIAVKARIPGFRPGKAPRTVVETMFGKQAILSEALERWVPEAYDRAIKMENLEPVDQPQLDIQEAELDKPFSFIATIPLRPTVELGEVQSITLTRPLINVEPAEEDKVLEELRRARAEMTPVEGRGLQTGDGAEVRMSLVAGEVERTWDQPFRLVIGDNWMPQGFDAKVAGMQVGDVRVFDLDLPADHYDEELRNKRATFTVELVSIKTPVLPELTDEFAAAVSEFPTVDGLRENVRKRLAERKQQQAELELRQAALDSLVARSGFEIPEVLIERRAGEIIQSRTNMITAQGLALETYLATIGKAQEDWRRDAREDAVQEIRRAVAIQEFAKVRGIEVEDSEMKGELELLAMQFPESDREAARRAYGSGPRSAHLEHTIRDRKALDALVGEVAVEDPGAAEAEEPPAPVRMDDQPESAAAEEPADA